MKKFISLALTCALLAAVLSACGADKKKPMESGGYQLVFEDGFDGGELDLSNWQYYAGGSRRKGFNAPSQVRVENGNLIIKQEYRTAEDGEYGEGWYTGAVSSTKKYTKGYFECRCICNKTVHDGFWSAFWLQADNPYDPEISKGGPGGAEIDIFEAYEKRGTPYFSVNIHLAGKEGSDNAQKGELDSLHVAHHTVRDMFKEYHTYALEWDDESYKFFFDGKMIAESSWGDGVSQVPEEVILSLEPSDNPPEDKSVTSEFKIDYIRIYQKNGETK